MTQVPEGAVVGGAQVTTAAAMSGGFGHALVQNGWNTNVLRPVRGLAPNGLLRHEEWRDFDEMILPVARASLSAVDDLLSRGLVHPVSNIGKTILSWERAGDMGPAEETMTGQGKSAFSALDFELDSVPLPLVVSDFPIDIRRLEASRTLGEPIDVTQGMAAGMKVSEKLEDILLTGSSIKLDGNQATGYTNYAHRLTTTIAEHWNGSSATGETILADVLAMIEELQKANFYGPYCLYVDVEDGNALRGDFKDDSDKSIMTRLMEIDVIEKIRVVPRLASVTGSNVLMVQMTATVVDMAVAQGIQTVQWPEMAGFIQWFRVWACMIPRIKRSKAAEGDPHGNTGDLTGICHGSKT